jgi:hypothetical protein
MRAPLPALLGAAALTFLLALCTAAPARAAEEPPLPPGLGGEKPTPKSGGGEPSLPEGLGGEKPVAPASGEPDLPPGLEGEPGKTPPQLQPEKKPFRLPFDFSGFAEGRLGGRLQEDEREDDLSIAELRLRLEAGRRWEHLRAELKADLVYDAVDEEREVDLETGRGWFDLREASLAGRPLEFADVKLGRQTLTWGTGDLLFINDLFPKDWNSFFIGRDDEYLKAPSDALKVGLFSASANLDLVWTPRFDADRFIDGRRISYWNGDFGRRVGREAIVEYDAPDRWFRDDELAARLYRSAGSYELAVYAYRGFWKSPAGQDASSGEATFPDLAVYGASARGPVGPGIGNVEFGWYDSSDDRDGDDPLVRNGELRFLAGYEQELARDLTAGVQWYVEHMLDHDDYRGALPPGAPEADESRHVMTVRLTRLLMKQNLRLSLFTYWSPTDRDVYFRPKASYKIDDHWSAEVGGNVFAGEDEHTFFGQFEKNNNIYAAVRWGF